MGSIHFFEEKPAAWFKGRRAMKALLIELFRKEKVELDAIQYVLVSDEALLEVNRSYLNHDYYTDIITFDLSAPGSAKVSDIYISLDRVEENAKQYNQSRINELRRVMIHGCLHLCGYKDKLKTDQLRMREREDYYLRLYTKRST
ncbi:MAG: rRNA maturation RNase YbeY [Sphingobacteriales bacterium]|jgi:rRNA maturation RNase YbeY